MFNKREYDESGVISATFFDCGAPVEVLCDDRFPCRPWGDGWSPVCSKNEGNELWTMALEKLFAKFYGSYQGIGSGGYGYYAFHQLTGRPSMRVNQFDEMNDEAKENLWKNLELWDKRDYPMTVGAI